MMLVIRDMDVSRRCYQEVMRQDVFVDLQTYVEFKRFCLMTEEQWCEFQTVGDLVCCYGNNVCQLSFEEEDLDGYLEYFGRFPGIEVQRQLHEYEWGQRSLRFYDPDRHIIEVCEAMTTVAKRFLRSGLSIEETSQRMMYPREFVQDCHDELSEE